jgi:ribosome modulation factor
MKIRVFAIPALAVLLVSAGPLIGRANGLQVDTRAERDRDWQTAPQELNEIQSQGFRDGIEGARKDVGNHRTPNVENRDEYRRPNVPDRDWDAYRSGFRRGYETGISHLMGQTSQSPMQYSGAQYGNDWETAPQELNDVQRQGFHDGIEGARKDIGNHRTPNVNNRDEYRNPNVPGRDRKAYREGFRRGYETGISHLMGGGDRR